MTALQCIDRPAVVVHLPNAFQPARDRSIQTVMQAQTVRAWLDDQGIEEFAAPTLCIFNSVPLMRADWHSTIIAPGDICIFAALPHGGGGGGGKNPLRTVMTIAVMVAAAYSGGAFATALLGESAAGSFSYMAASFAASTAVAAAGDALINALVPPPKPPGFGGSIGAPSPTYTLSGQGNSARLGQAIPCQYGRHRVFPDLIVAQPWAEFIGNEQYLYQPHCLGLGEYDVHKIQIGETKVGNFKEITYQIVRPGQVATLFDINVITRPEVSGQELKGAGANNAVKYVGPFTLNPVDTVANKVGVDIVFPRGLYVAANSGALTAKTITWKVEARKIDDDDKAAGGWLTLGNESHSASSNTPIRRTYTYTLALHGRYEIRLSRTNTKDTSARAAHEIRWAGLRAFVTGPTKFDDVTLLLVKMRATDNLSQRSSRSVNVVQTRKLRAWDAVGKKWSVPKATRSPVWAACDVAQAAYGAGLADDRLPLADLAALDTVLKNRKDRFDGVFDSKTTIWDALTRIARCGRAVPILQGGILRLMRDAKQNLPVAMFGPRNIVKGSFNMSYVLPSDDTADAVTVEYFNERTWKPAEVTAKMSDSSADKPAKVNLFGCVTKDHAEREGKYMAADNRYRRKMITFRTELDGMIPTYGDLISVTHDLPRRGQGGEIVARADDVLTLSEPPEFTAGKTHYIALRQRDGAVAGPFKCEAGTEPDQVRLLEPLTITPYLGSAQERTYFSFGPGDKWSQLCRELAIKPRQGGEQVEISAVAEDNRVHVN